MITIKLKFCGVFKDFFNSEIDMEFSDIFNIVSFKSYLSKTLVLSEFDFLNDVLDKSSFSDGSVILSDDYILKCGDIIYLLPPFSGG